MSFFEQMMKLTLPKKYHPESNTQQEEQPEIQQQQQDLQPSLSHSSRQNLAQSQSLTFNYEPEEQHWQDISSEPSIRQVRVGPKPQFLHNVLSLKQQMIRQMLEKKLQFEQKKQRLCRSRNGVQLQMRLGHESQKIKESQFMSVKPSSSSKQGKENNQSSKLTSSKKSKQLLNLSSSISSVNPQMQMIVSPTADHFNKEIMMKLLQIIEQDRSRPPPLAAQPLAYPHELHDKSKEQKDTPIIINNIMKTPMESVSRDLIERQMKIKMLENTRSQRQQKYKCANLNNKQENLPCREFTEQMVLTERTNSRPSTQGFEVVSSSCKKEVSAKKDPPSTCNFQENKENYLLQEIISNTMDLGIKTDPKVSNEQSTKNNSSQNSRVKQFGQTNNGRKKRQFRQQSFRAHHNNQVKEEIKQQTPEEAPIIRAAVKLEIPLQNHNQSTECLTLAEAFKKRVGRLKSEQKRGEKQAMKSSKKHSQQFQAFPSQMTISITDKMTEYNSDFDFSAPPSVKIRKTEEEPLSKRTNLTKARSKKKTERDASTQKTEGPFKKMSQPFKKMSSPSKQLMDRLIYGERAKVSKEEMYALTRKNYNNLPEVQAKKREQQKRKLEQERLTKAREYQKAIRSVKPKV